MNILKGRKGSIIDVKMKEKKKKVVGQTMECK